MVRTFQGATQALRYADVPVVVVPGGPDARRRLRDRAARRPRAGGRRELHRPGRSRRRPDSGGRRHQGNAGASGRARCRIRGRTCCRAFSGVRNDRLRQGLDERRRRDAARLSARRRRDHDEPRTPDGRRQGRRARTRARRLPPAGAAHGDPGRRRQRCSRRSSSASTWPGARAASAITTRSSAGRWPGSWRAARCRTRRPCPSSTCWISSARRSSSCAASGRRSNGFSTRSRPASRCRN